MSILCREIDGSGLSERQGFNCHLSSVLDGVVVFNYHASMLTSRSDLEVVIQVIMYCSTANIVALLVQNRTLLMFTYI